MLWTEKRAFGFGWEHSSLFFMLLPRGRNAMARTLSLSTSHLGTGLGVVSTEVHACLNPFQGLESKQLLLLCSMVC